jgi:hypothetical protein
MNHLLTADDPATIATTIRTGAAGRARPWTGRTLSGLAILFLLFDTVLKVLRLPVALEGTGQLGYAHSAVFAIGLVELGCVLAYAIPRTSIVGAVLLTGYLGGAIATHVRVGSPLFSHTLFPIYVAALIWGGLYLRDSRLRALIGAASGRR